MDRFNAARLVAVIGVSAALSACDGPATPSRVCVDENKLRAPDSQCPPPGSGVASVYRWYYMGGSHVPAVGASVSGGSFVPATGASYAAAPVEGISRGGFGGTAEGFGGGDGGAGE